MKLVVRGAAERDRRLLRERDRQDEAVVVVGVLAEQVDPARRARDGLGSLAERGQEARLKQRHLDRLQLARLVALGPFWVIEDLEVG